MRKFSILFIVMILASFSAISQNADQKLLSLIPQERVYIHHSTTELFTGDRMHYKIYVFDTSNKKLSEISKVAYVNLIDGNGESVFLHKLKLENGQGYGDFLIPTSVVTGSYKLLGYSQWMKNGNRETIFQSDIKIINPYTPLNPKYLDLVTTTDSLVPAFPKQNALDTINKNKIPAVENTLLDINLSKETITTRDKVSISFSSLGENKIKGNYSLSVRQLSVIDKEASQSLQDFFKGFQNGVAARYVKGNTIHLPELRGEILSGIVTNMNDNKPAKNIKVSLSVPDKNYLFLIATTNDYGQFYFNIDQRYSNDVAALQLLVEDSEAYTINMDPQTLDYSNFSFNKFKISSDLKDAIVERSVQNQLENAYSEIRNDSIVQTFQENPFYVNLDESYLLDDYNRFFTIKETIVEIVNNVSIINNKDGERIFQVRPPEGDLSNVIEPLLFVDGLFIEKHESFMDYSAKQIKSISFSRPKYLLGSKLFQGVISFETIEGDFNETFYTPEIYKINLLKPEPKKLYFLQEYNADTAEKTKRIPDYRHQLLWNPVLEIESDTIIDFYTSDVIGDYEIVLNGFTDSGQPISIKKEFSVK